MVRSLAMGIESRVTTFLSPARTERTGWQRYAVALLCTGVAWFARAGLSSLVGDTAIPYIFFFPAVAAAGWYGGRGPAIAATVSSTILATWFIEPVRRFEVAHPTDLVSLGAFLLSSSIIIVAMDALHRGRRRVVEARDFVSTTLSSIGDGVIVSDGAGHVAFLNPEAERLTGWSSAEAAGKPLATVFRIREETTGRPVEDPAQKVLRTGAVVGIANHTLLVSRTAGETPIDDSAAPVKNREGEIVGVVLVFRDVTEQRSVQRSLAQLSTIVEQSGDAIFTKSLDGIVQTWNASAERLFGYRSDEIVGKSITMLIPPEREEEEQRILASLRAGRRVERTETIRVAKNGRRIHVALSVSPLRDAEGQIIGASKIVQDITDLRAAREALEAEKNKLATTLASIGDAVIVTDDGGRISFMNHTAEQITGWTQPEASGRELPVVFHILNEYTRRPVENPVEKVLRTGAIVGLANHTILVTRDGAEIPIDDSAAPIRHGQGDLFGIVLVFRDIRERRQSEEALRQSEERFRRMADAAPVLIWIRDTDKSCTWFNQRWLEFVGRTMEQEVGSGWTENIHPEDSDQCLRIYTSSFDAREPFTMEYRLRRHDGEYRWVLDQGVPLYGRANEFTGYVGSCIDITERKRAEEVLVEGDRKKDEFLATLSHELRNPVAPIRLAVALLRKQGPHDPHQEELRDIIERQTDQLARLLDDLLDVSRIASGKIVLRTGRVSLRVALATALEASRPLLESMRHELVVRIAPETIEVDADVARLSQVFSNLLNNAAKYTEPGGRIVLEAALEDRQAVVRVSDNGIGIAPAQLSTIFVMFSQADTSLERRQAGLGVGLSLAKALVEAHGGSIEAESDGLGKGSRFTVRLPAMSGAGPAMLPPAGREAGAATVAARRILVADDNEDAAATLAMLLRVSGHEVSVVHDGQAVLDALATFRPELAILDIGMPKMNGYDVARRLRAQLGSDIVLVAVTGWGQESDRRRALEAGFDIHLTKPVDPPAIERAVVLCGRTKRP